MTKLFKCAGVPLTILHLRVCLIYFSVSKIKHHDQGNFQRKTFPLGLMVLEDWSPKEMSESLKAGIAENLRTDYKHEAEKKRN